MAKPNLSEESKIWKEIQTAWAEVSKKYDVRPLRQRAFGDFAHLANMVIFGRIRVGEFERQMRVLLSKEGVKNVAAVAEETADRVGAIKNKYRKKERPLTKLEELDRRVTRLEKESGIRGEKRR